MDKIIYKSIIGLNKIRNSQSKVPNVILVTKTALESFVHHSASLAELREFEVFLARSAQGYDKQSQY